MGFKDILVQQLFGLQEGAILEGHILGNLALLRSLIVVVGVNLQCNAVHRWDRNRTPAVRRLHQKPKTRQSANDSAPHTAVEQKST